MHMLSWILNKAGIELHMQVYLKFSSFVVLLDLVTKTNLCKFIHHHQNVSQKFLLGSYKVQLLFQTFSKLVKYLNCILPRYSKYIYHLIGQNITYSLQRKSLALSLSFQFNAYFSINICRCK